MARRGSGFWIIVDTISPHIQLSTHFEDEAIAAAEAVAEKMVAYAHDNAPWTDDTGAAREGLYSSVDSSGDMITVTLSHSVDYGQWLETIQSGQYAIIMPTIEQYAAEVEDAIGNAFMFGGG